MGEKVIAVSGGFDPIHVGHLRMMQDAAQHGKLIVIVNWEERAELIGAYDFVDEVVKAKDDNRTVVESLEEIKPDIFANGGDRGNVNTPEVRFCRENGIEMMWGVGGHKVQSSSSMVTSVTQKKRSKDLKKYRDQVSY